MWQRWSSYHQRVIIIMIRHLLLGLPYRLVEHTAPSHLNGWSWWSEWWWWLWSLTKDVDDNIDDYKEEEWGTYVNMWWSISDKDDDLAKWKKIMCDPINVCTFSSAASWLQSLINLQLFFFVIVVLLLIWWWRGWWGWRLLEIVTASKCWYHDWHQNGQASTPLWPGERRSTFLQAIGLLLCVSF